MKYAAININFDSLGEAYGFPHDYRDPSFFEVVERFLDLARKYDFKYSIYLIGKDLEKPANREAVKRWAEAGHEIGNHSWSHRQDLGALSRDEIYREVEMAHTAISDTIGYEPRGFIAPGWSTSSNLLKVLIDLGYVYDTSSFPSWLLYPSLIKLSLNHLRDSRLGKIWNRRDLLNSFIGPRNVYDTHGSLIPNSRGTHPSANNHKMIRELPLPANRHRMACWHTLAFVFGWKWQRHNIVSCLRDVDAFYYLLHPADLMEVNDLDPGRKCHIERMNVPLEKKLFYLEEAVKLILDSNRRIVTMRELAEKCPPTRQ